VKFQSKNEDIQGILSKTRGYCARIAMVIHSLELALESIRCDELEQQDWDSRVSVKAIKSASAITDHLNKQKFIMLGVDVTDPDGDSSQTGALTNRTCRLLSITWKADHGTITPSEVSQKHLCERVGQSYPSSKAMEKLSRWDMEPLKTPQPRMNEKSPSFAKGFSRISQTTVRNS
jgi:hypothetical protein